MRDNPRLRQQILHITDLNGGTNAMNLKKAAQLVGCDPRTLRDRMKLKRQGRRYIVSVVALAEWMVSNA